MVKKNYSYLWNPMVKEKHRHFKLYKPFGMISQLNSNEQRQLRSKRFLSELCHFPEGIMPIGRLDEKSEGLLLLTTDGKLADTINRKGIEKEYYAQLDGIVTQEAVGRLQAGVEIGFFGKKYITKKCKVEPLKTIPRLPDPNPAIRSGRHRPGSWIRIVLTEGKYRQVRKMTAAVGFPTLRLVRVRIGCMHLGNMSSGEVQEVDNLRY